MDAIALPQPPPLTAAAMHLWQLPWRQVQAQQTAWYAWLSTDERDRAQRFLRPVDRDRFILSRGGLRYLLGQYLHCPPQTITLAYGTYGKPCLHASAPPLHFNLAHSDDWVIYGFSRCPWLGVDVEQLTRRRHLEGLIQRCLTPAEQATLPPTPTARLQTFLHYWTIKEAHLKAIGQGLSYPMRAVQVSLHPLQLEQPAQVDHPPSAWALHLWSPGPGAIAAACIGESAQPVFLPFLGDGGKSAALTPPTDG